PHHPHRLKLLAAYTLLALATLTKGPLAIILALLAILPQRLLTTPPHIHHTTLPTQNSNPPQKKSYQLYQRLYSLTTSLLNKTHLIGILLFLTISLSWFALAYLSMGNQFIHTLWEQNVSRFSGKYTSHLRPLYYYLITLPTDLLPWSIYLPLLYLWIRKKNLSPNTLSLLLWITLTFAFFSASQSKQAKYLMPILPPISILLAQACVELSQQKPTTKWLSLPSWILSTLFLLLGLITLTATYIRPELFQNYGKTKWQKYLPLLQKILSQIYLPSLLFLLLASILIYTLLKQKYVLYFFIATSGILPLKIAIFSTVFPPINPYKSTRNFAKKINEIIPPQTPWCMYGIYRSGFVYYSRRFCTRLDAPHMEDQPNRWQIIQQQLQHFLDKNPNAFVLTLQHFYQQKIPTSLRSQLLPVHQQQVGSKHWILLKNHPP
ncbi:MAG: hypothetical protein D6805_06870, partial [Planctomycetota bacterium]